MDVSALRTLNEDLAEFLAEVTVSDLRRPGPPAIGDIGDLYLHIINQNLTITAAVTSQPAPVVHRPDRASLGAVVDNYGNCGLEAPYRQTTHLLENAFTADTNPGRLRHVNGLIDLMDVASLYETQIGNTVLHTWDIAHALGLPYQPAPELAQRALRAIARHIMRPPTTADGAQPLLEPAPSANTFDRVLLLSGRSPAN